MEYKIEPQEKLNLGLRELWQFRELFFFFTWRDIKVKYKQTVLGFVWAVLQPLLMMVIFTLFFGRALNVPSENIPYPVFVFSGLLLWNIFSSGLSAAGNSMVSNANIIKKIYFPRLIIPVSSILVALFDFFMAFIIYMILLIIYDVQVNLLQFFVFLFLSLLLTVFGTLGPGCLLAALNIKFRDFRYIIPFLVQFLLFLTPVIYPVSVIKYDWLKFIVALNPVSGAIELFRTALTNKPVDWLPIAISAFSAIIFFISGLFYFRKTEAYFADLA